MPPNPKAPSIFPLESLEQDDDEMLDVADQRSSAREPLYDGQSSRRGHATSSSSSSRHRHHRAVEHYIPAYLRSLVFPYHGDFCVTTLFHPQLLAQLMMEGFLPIAAPDGILLPKLHDQRCVVMLHPDPVRPVRKSVRKKASRYTVTFNRDFAGVVRGCQAQHGRNCWLYDDLVAGFAALRQGVSTTIVDQTGQRAVASCQVQVVSMEIWHAESKTLAGGELGYIVGGDGTNRRIYTSLTGWSDRVQHPSAGSVQLACLGRMLQQSGFAVWDLGMEMDYKMDLGATLVPRAEWVELVQTLRRPPSRLDGTNDTPFWLTANAEWNAKDLLDAKLPSDLRRSVSPSPNAAPSTTRAGSPPSPKRPRSGRSGQGTTADS